MCSWSRGSAQSSTRSNLCSFSSSTVAASSSVRSLLSVSKFLHGFALPCSIPPAFHLGNQHSSTVSKAAGLLCACSFSARSPGGPLITCTICTSVFLMTTYLALSQREYKQGSCFQMFPGVCFTCVSLTSHFYLSIFFFFPKGSFALQGKSLSVSFTVVAITLSSPEPELRCYRWKKLAGLSVSLRKNIGQLGNTKQKRNDLNLIRPLGMGCAACLVNNAVGKFMQMCASPPTSQSFHFSVYIFPPPQST